MIVGASVGSLSVLDTTTAYWVVGVALVFFGLGGANVMAPATDAVMAALPESQAGIGSAINDTTRQIGGALGVGIFGSVLNSLYTSNVSTAVAALPSEMAALAENSVGGALQVAADIGGEGGQALTEAANGAFVDASGIVFLTMGIVGVIGAIVAARFPPRVRPWRRQEHRA